MESCNLIIKTPKAEPIFNSLNNNSDIIGRRVTIRLVDESGASSTFARALDQTIAQDQVPSISVRVEMPTVIQIKTPHKGHMLSPGHTGVKFPAYVLPT